MHTLRRTIAGVVFELTGLADITMLLTRLHTPVTLKAMLVSGPILQEQGFTITTYNIYPFLSWKRFFQC